jgi:tetratricopeptide (TPR) repeat protein
VKRTAFADEDGTTVVVVGGKPGKAYEVLGFEVWAPFGRLYEAGDYAEAADQARRAIEARPDAVGAFFCLACCEALAGRLDDAARHLRHALERSERLRGLARRNSDLDSIRDRPEIAELLAG